jgi:hypothetical protein
MLAQINMENPITEIISQRELEFVSDSGKESVQVCLGKPVKEKDGVWRCPYFISANSFERRFRICGEDSMQALILALKSITNDLEVFAKQYKGHFTWFDQQDVGLPFIVK